MYKKKNPFMTLIQFLNSLCINILFTSVCYVPFLYLISI
uniref:Uncharacterized protein n=1 Tax=Anguilla anguilla TaxID=7936 RepID=A0A0E9QD18_ANGAN